MQEIEKQVHACYWVKNINCTRTMLLCLSKQFAVPIGSDLYAAAAGMHGAGGFGAQCGLVEGVLLFIGLLYSQKGLPEEQGIDACYEFATEFRKKFGWLECRRLRAKELRTYQLPHVCEALTVRTISFASDFLKQKL